MQEKESIIVCLPGREFSCEFMKNWNTLYAHLLRNFKVVIAHLYNSNQYKVRDKMTQDVRQGKWGAEFWLWLDSDNILTPEGFDYLFDTIEGNKEIAGVGGWYFIHVDPPIVCAALDKSSKEDFTEIEPVSIEMIQDAFSEHSIIEVNGHMGFGAFLVRDSVMENAGDFPFSPIIQEDGNYCGDDVSFFRRQIKNGHKFFLHPAVYLPHLKLGEIAIEIARDVLSKMWGVKDKVATFGS